MILTGLVAALAVIVDDAIIDARNIARRLNERRSAGADKSMMQVLLEASFESRSSMVYATIMILLAVIPVFFITGFSGALLQPLAMSYVLAILASMVVALTVTPALSAMLLSGTPQDENRSPLVAALMGAYETAASWVLNKPSAAYAAAAVIFFAGIIAWPQLGQQSLVPTFKENDVLVELEGPPGTSRDAMRRVLTKATKELRVVPGVRNVSANVGRAVLSDAIVDVNSAELWVSVDTGADYEGTISNIQRIIDGYVGFNPSVVPYLKKKTREAVTGEDDAIVVRVFGHNLDVLREKADEVRMAIAKVNGVTGAQVDRQSQWPTLEIKPDLEKAKDHGIKPGDIRRAATTLLSGIEVGSLFEKQKVFDVVVWGVPETRHSLTSVSNLTIDTPKGGHVKLKDVADLRIVPTVNVIERDGVARRIDVTANVHGRDIGSVSADVERAVRKISFPLEYHAEVVGEYQERQAAQSRVSWYALAAVVAIFLLMQATMGSWRVAATVLITLPIALVGGILAAFINGGVASLGTLVGLLAIFSIALRNSVALINHLQHLEHQEGMSFGPDLILRGVRERFMPVIMTAGVIALVLVPILFGGNIPGQEILYPMAIVVLGGLITTLLLNLFILPALYMFLGSGSKPDTYMAELKMGAS
jgi:Cu/Ag efflux pump CusA